MSPVSLISLFVFELRVSSTFDVFELVFRVCRCGDFLLFGCGGMGEKVEALFPSKNKKTTSWIFDPFPIVSFNT